MLNSLALCGGSAITPSGQVDDSVILIEAGRIAAIGTPETVSVQPGVQRIDTAGCMVLPGFIDTHIHGCNGDDVMTSGPVGIARMAQGLCRYGVTGFLPTTIAAPHEAIMQAIHACLEARRIQSPASAHILGIHLEGPYINPVRKGAQPLEGIRPPDLKQCREYLEAGAGAVRLMTLAPELPGGFEMVRLLCDHGVVPSMGHTDADYDTAVAAIRHGATHATHLFNQMTPLHQRNPGVVAAFLTDPGATVELITDGVHVAPAMIKIAFRLKGKEAMTLITDAIEAMGMPEGEYNLGSHRVHVENGRCTLPDGTLSGSVHRMDRAVSNTMKFTGCSLEDASHMASAGPARLAGVRVRKGSLEIEQDADVVVLRDGEVQLTLVEGVIAYDRHVHS